jgi:hypothetical protein
MSSFASFFGFGAAPAPEPKKNGATAPRMNGNGPNLELGPGGVAIPVKMGGRRHQSRKQKQSRKQRQSRKQ